MLGFVAICVESHIVMPSAAWHMYWKCENCIIYQKYLLFIILQESIIIKVEKDIENLSEEESIDMKSENVYIPPTVAIKTELEVRFAVIAFVHLSV
jgi:hypothetical protein